MPGTDHCRWQIVATSSIIQIANLEGHRILLTWASLFELTSGPLPDDNFGGLDVSW
jgi:hypothetical protein